jgi:molybdopterin molybdotransferase/putative molybdopterin biosynthesis protein
MDQQQFLNVLDRDEAERRFHAELDLSPLAAEQVALESALGRVLAADVLAPVDVPSFDRANVDGFAVRAEDTFGASEERPRQVRLTGETLATGVVPAKSVAPGCASAIATGAMVPRGADAVVMIEHTDSGEGALIIRRPVTPGANITYAGTDIGRGETVLRRGELLTSRETGVLAALGVTTVWVVRRPRIAILSTGDEIIAPGQPMKPGLVYDSNATILADAVRELGGMPIMLGIVPDELAALRAALTDALAYDVVLLSGGTSKGEGDLCYRVVGELGPPGIIAHGVALKPGKPLCLAAARRSHRAPSVGLQDVGDGNNERAVPVAILPGFPTSAIFTFHEFVAPVIRALAGRRANPAAKVVARLPMRVNSERGRTEYLLVGLVSDQSGGLVAYPMGKGSGSVTTFSRADGFVVIGRQQEYLDAGNAVDVHLLSAEVRPADLVVIGSHCVGLDFLLGLLHERGVRAKFLAVGSTAGLEAARRGECDLAGIHLFEPKSGEYNRPFVTADLMLVPGYQRLQGIVFRAGDERFARKTLSDALAAVRDRACVMVNRNRGSGTRILTDELLRGARPDGYHTEARSHNAVVAAVAQGRADWGVAIATVARDAGLGFLPIQEEHYDFVMPRTHLERPAAKMFRDLLDDPSVRNSLKEMGFGA